MATVDTQPEAKVNLLDYDQAGLETLIERLGFKRFHGRQLFKWIHKHGLTDFSLMTDLGKQLRARLAETAEIRLPEITFSQQSADGTHKWLLRLQCGNQIETVYIPDGNRATLCVSSQVGCALDCSFCATARQGFNRNLSCAEIIGQVWIASRQFSERLRPITNVVLMGMGEPLANFDAVVRATHIMQDDFAYGLSKYRVTLSTAGIVPNLLRLKDASTVSLAISLHATNNALRDELVPINRKYPLEQLLDACRDFIAGEKHRRITFEYVMLDGVNDSDLDAKRLVRLLQGIPAKVNLIPFNPFPGSQYRSSPAERIVRFQEILGRSGFVTTTRRTRGDDIDAACGQLAGRVQDRSKRTVNGCSN